MSVPSPTIEDFLSKVRDPKSIDLVTQETAIQQRTSTIDRKPHVGAPPPPSMNPKEQQ